MRKMFTLILFVQIMSIIVIIVTNLDHKNNRYFFFYQKCSGKLFVVQKMVKFSGVFKCRLTKTSILMSIWSLCSRKCNIQDHSQILKPNLTRLLICTVCLLIASSRMEMKLRLRQEVDRPSTCIQVAPICPKHAFHDVIKVLLCDTLGSLSNPQKPGWLLGHDPPKWNKTLQAGHPWNTVHATWHFKGRMSDRELIFTVICYIVIKFCAFIFIQPLMFLFWRRPFTGCDWGIVLHFEFLWFTVMYFSTLILTRKYWCQACIFQWPSIAKRKNIRSICRNTLVVLS